MERRSRPPRTPVRLHGSRPGERLSSRTMTSFALHGIGVSGGIAIGRAQLISHATLEVAHYTIAADQVAAEIARFDDALVARCRRELEAPARGDTCRRCAGGVRRLPRRALDDPATTRRSPRCRKRIIAEQRCNAEWALTQQMNVLVDAVRPDRGPVPAGAHGRRRAGRGARAEAPARQARRRCRRMRPTSSTILVAHDLSPADVDPVQAAPLRRAS